MVTSTNKHSTGRRRCPWQRCLWNYDVTLASNGISEFRICSRDAGIHRFNSNQVGRGILASGPEVKKSGREVKGRPQPQFALGKVTFLTMKQC